MPVSYAIMDARVNTHRVYVTRPGSNGRVLAFAKRRDAIRAVEHVRAEDAVRSHKLVVERVDPMRLAHASSACIGVDVCVWNEGIVVMHAIAYAPGSIVDANAHKERLERDFAIDA